MKKLTLALCVALMVSLFAGCGGAGGNSTAPDAETPAASETEPAADNTPDDSADTADSDDTAAPDSTLVMATEAGFRPYEYYEGTDIVGVDVDIAREIADALGMELVVEHMEFGAIIPAVDSGKADFGAAGMSVTEERLEKVDFTIEYATSKQVIMTTADSDIMTDADLAGRDVGVQLGTVADLALEEDYPDVNVTPYNKYMEAVNDLVNGRIDAIVLDVLPAQELLTMDESLVIRDEELFTDVYAFCVKKGNTELLDAMNTVMQRLLDEGKIEAFTATHSAN